MLLTIRDAATRLGLTERQIRYRIRNNELRAEKIGGVWMIDEAALPVSPATAQRAAASAADLRQAVESALAPAVRGAARYSAAHLRAFKEAVEAGRLAQTTLGADHDVVRATRTACVAIARGAHAFRGREKAHHYEAARAAAAEGVAIAWLDGRPDAMAVSERLEASVLPALAGLLRRADGGAG